MDSGHFKKQRIKNAVWHKKNKGLLLLVCRQYRNHLLYNRKYIKEYRSLLPAAISTKKQIEELTDILGEFCDRITGIHLVETYLFATSDPADKVIIEETISKWNTEKNELRLKIYSMLNYRPA